MREKRGGSAKWRRGVLPSRADNRRRENEDRSGQEATHRIRIHINGRGDDGGGDAGVALVEGNCSVAIRICGRRVPVDVVLRFEGVAVFAGRAEVQVVGLAFGEVVVEHRTRERR